MTTDGDWFWPRVDRSGGPEACWPWTGGRVKGYGRVKVSGKTIRAHRLAFFFEHGRWPEPCGCHSCDNPPCCNPRHIFEGTNLDNSKDCVSKGRQAKGDAHYSRTQPDRLARGARHPNYRLSPQDKFDIVANRILCRVTFRELAERYKVSIQAIWRVCQ